MKLAKPYSSTQPEPVRPLQNVRPRSRLTRTKTICVLPQRRLSRHFSGSHINLKQKVLPSLSPIKAEKRVRQPRLELKHAWVCEQGTAKSYSENQDACIVVPSLCHGAASLFGVIDGHGPNGHFVASYVKQYLPESIEHRIRTLSLSAPLSVDTQRNIRTGLIHACGDLNRSLIQAVDCEFSGCAFACTLFIGQHCFAFNVGDCLASLGIFDQGRWQTEPLSASHKPSLAQEKARIEAAGGFVEPVVSEHGYSLGPARVWAVRQQFPGLAMSRSLGDTTASSVGVCHYPEVKCRNVSATDKFVVIGSDGLWDRISLTKATCLVSSYYHRRLIHEPLTNLLKAVRAAKKHKGTDDVSIVLVYLS